MLKMLRHLLGPDSVTRDGPHRNHTLHLPAGVIVAELGLQHRQDARSGPSVTPLQDEAYMVMRLDNGSCWYAAWHPYLGHWDLLNLDQDQQNGIEPATAPPRPLKAGAC